MQSTNATMVEVKNIEASLNNASTDSWVREMGRTRLEVIWNDETLNGAARKAAREVLVAHS